MGVFENFPYTNFHEMNLDWIVTKVKEVITEWIEYKESVDAELTEFRTWFDNLDVQDEVRVVINEMVASGEFLDVTEDTITTTVTAWLTEHITPTTPIVDDTLTISGAAADAKVAGDRILDLKEDSINYEKYFIGEINPIETLTWTEGYYIAQDGTIAVDNAFHYSSLIEIDNAYNYIFAWSSLKAGFIRIHGYDVNGNWVEQIDQFSSGTEGETTKLLPKPSATVKYFRISIRIASKAIALYHNKSVSERLEYLEDTIGVSTITLDNLTNENTYIGENGTLVSTSLAFASSGMIYGENLSKVFIVRSPRIAGGLSIAFYRDAEFTSESLISGYANNSVTLNHEVEVPAGTKYIAFSSRTNEGAFTVELTYNNIVEIVQDNASKINSIVNHPHSGEKLSILGDSISTYLGYCPSANSMFYPKTWFTSVEDTWWKKLLNETEMELLVNNSSSGSHMATTAELSGLSRCGNLDDGVSVPDHVIVYMGINDFANGNGVIGECGLNPSTYDVNNFSDAYYTALNTIKTNYPNAKLYLGTIMQYAQDVSFPNKKHNHYLTEYNDAVRKLADIFGAKVIEFSNCGIDFFNESITLGDTLHPNAIGHNLMFKEAVKHFK